MTAWLSYCAAGLLLTLERVRLRAQKFSAKTKPKQLVLCPKQEQLLRLLRDHKSPRPARNLLAVSKQGALDLLRPLLQAGLVKRIGTQ